LSHQRTGELRLRTIDVGGIPFVATNVEGVEAWLLAHGMTHGPESGVNVRFLNAYCVALASRNPEYRDMVCNSGVNFPDGKPVAWVMRLKARKRRDLHPEQTRGPSVFARVLSSRGRADVRHFFLGATPETLASIVNRVEQDNPDARIAGTFSPPFAEPDQEYIETCATHISEANPTIVWIGLGTPKQDFVGARLAGATSSLCVNVGAAFDFYARTTAEAPTWMQRAGLEWLHRLVSEPRRLARRYFVGNVQFLWAVLRYDVFGRVEQRPS